LPLEFRPPQSPSIYYITNTLHPLCVFFHSPPRQRHALQTLCHPSSPLQRRRPSFPSRALFGVLTISQVRAVVAPSDDLILSASRDSTAISWIKASDSPFSPAHTFRAGSRFINAVAYLKPTPEAQQGKNMSCQPDFAPLMIAACRLHRYRRSRLDHKHMGNRGK